MSTESTKTTRQTEKKVYSENMQDTTLKITNRRYLGSKQKLLNFIKDVVEEHTENIKSVADIFGGTGSVANIFREQGKKIIINDILRSNQISYKTWFGNESVDMGLIKKCIDELNALVPESENYVSINFGDKYFSMDNARKIGSIRKRIDEYNINKRERAFLLTSLLYAIDKVANTVGHYDAYRKKMDNFHMLHLKVPEYNQNKNNEIYNEDANSLVRKIKADLVYIDTPYNSRQYGDTYHLLENIIDWNQPKVEGVARKMVDRKHIKSKYSTQKAPIIFEDLIQNIDTRYILVSYNNMAQKGCGRSNAKISNEEILQSLQKRGSVQVFYRPFKVFTAGKTAIQDHQELLYLCKVNPQKKERGRYVQSAVNYTGGKYRLLPQIIPKFPRNIKTFYDIFGGGANVAINVNVKEQVIINDVESHIIELYRYIQKSDFETMLRDINEIIKDYNLSDTKNKGYKFYSANSSIGLKDVNKEQYEKLREDFNRGLFSKENPLIFYILIVYAFNNQIRFNSFGAYNVPAGKRDFNSRMELKLKNFKEALTKDSIVLENKDFRVLMSEIEADDDIFVYLDPPYLISTASYNENGAWSLRDEEDLLSNLDRLSAKGVKFALSNVLEHKGRSNALLKKWSAKYNVYYLNYHYNNSNYQSKADSNRTVEVLVTNYNNDYSQMRMK